MIYRHLLVGKHTSVNEPKETHQLKGGRDQQEWESGLGGRREG